MAINPKRAMDFNPFAVGNVVYNSSSSSPHFGMPLDPLGYRERDRRARIRRNAVLRRMKAQAAKNFNDSDWLREKG